MKRFFVFMGIMFWFALVCDAGEFRKWGVEDIEWGTGTWTSAGGVTSTRLPYPFSGAAGTDNSIIIDVRSYGAIGDNTADDTVALQNAIDNAEANGGGVIILPPNKSFKITAALTLAQGAEGASGNDVWLVGSGWTSEIFNAGTGNAITIGTTDGDRTADVRVLSLLIRGQATSAHGIQVLRTHNMRIEGCRIRDNGGDGINFDRAYANWVLNNYVNNNTGDGFEAASQDVYGNDFTQLIGNRFLSNSANGIYFSNGNSSGARIERNDIEGNAIGIKLEAGATSSNFDSVSIVGNYFENQTGKNMSVGEDTSDRRIRNITIASNQINVGTVDAATNSVALDRVQYAVITGNFFSTSDLTTTVLTLYYNLFGNYFNLSASPSGGNLNLTNPYGLFHSDTNGQVDIGTTAEWTIRFMQGGTESWEITAARDLKAYVAGKGVVLTNAAGTVTKRVRLNDAGDGLIYEAE